MHTACLSCKMIAFKRKISKTVYANNYTFILLNILLYISNEIFKLFGLCCPTCTGIQHMVEAVLAVHSLGERVYHGLPISHGENVELHQVQPGLCRAVLPRKLFKSDHHIRGKLQFLQFFARCDVQRDVTGSVPILGAKEGVPKWKFVTLIKKLLLLFNFSLQISKNLFYFSLKFNLFCNKEISCSAKIAGNFLKAKILVEKTSNQIKQ